MPSRTDRGFRLGAKFRPSPALVVATVALMIALGGTGYAALSLPAGSIGTKQLKAGAVGTRQLKDGAVIARKVRRHTLLALDFAPGQLQRGPAGPPGTPGGPPGPKGPAGTARAYGVVHATGGLDGPRSKAIAAVSHPAVGIYCIALSGVDPSSTTLTATPNEADPGSSGRTSAHMNSSGPDCPAGRLEVVIRKIDISSGVITDHHTDNGFSFVVP